MAARPDPVTKYAREVDSGKVVACEWVKLACRRHLRLLKSGPTKGFRFDAEGARRALDFYRFLHHVKGEWAGVRIELSPWQQFVLGYTFGWRQADGTRLVRTAYVEVPRKNGKTTLAAGLALYLLLADGEPGAEIYVAATKRDQARLTFEPAKEMVRRSPALKKHANIYTGNVSVLKTNSKLEPLGADTDTMDGLNPHGLIIDELHAHKDRSMWDVLTSATGARRQPLVFVITTAGLGGGATPTVCRQEHDYSQQVLRGIVEDYSRVAYIATIDEGDDWADEKSWQKANPNYGISIKPAFLRQECEKAMANPAEQNKFRRYYLDEWVQQETRYIDLRAWDATAGTVRPDRLRGQSCVGGLDLANKVDLSALVLVFPPAEESGPYQVVPFFWVPRDGLNERSRRDRVPYDTWAQRGLIEITEGSVIDYALIRQRIMELSREYRIEEIVYDEWNAWQMAQELEAEGLTMIAMRQGYKSYNEPTKELTRLILSGRLRHGGNPVLRWMADNLVVSTDPAGNLKPAKERSREKIDGITALIMALSRAVLREDNQSIYDTRGILTL